MEVLDTSVVEINKSLVLAFILISQFPLKQRVVSLAYSTARISLAKVMTRYQTRTIIGPRMELWGTP